LVNLRQVQFIPIIAVLIALLSFLPNDTHAVSAAQQILFQDNYSSSAGWTQVGTQVTVNSPAHPGVVFFDNVPGGGGVDQNRVYKQIPSPLPSSNWIADFDYELISSYIPSAYPFVLTTSNADPELQGPKENSVIVGHGLETDQLYIRIFNSTGIIDSSTAIPILQNTQYFVRLDKTPTQLTLSVFLNPLRTIQAAGSPVILIISPTDLANLNFIQHSGKLSAGPARMLTAQLDNTKIYTTSAVCPDHNQGHQQHGEHCKKTK
jgi:hypothetical protein